MKSVYSPNDYQHLASDSAMIQAAVDEAAKYGAAVEIPRFNERTQQHLWELDETIHLHTGSTVYLNNCHIRLADFKYIGFFKNSALKDVHAAVQKKNRQYDITIVGMGNAVLDGGTPLDVKEIDFIKYDWEKGVFLGYETVKGMTSMRQNIGICFTNVERVKVSNIHFVNYRYWGMLFEFCSFGVVRDIHLEGMNQVPNQDGVNLRVGCSNFLVENVYGYTGDDAVALTGMDVARAKESDMSSDIHHIIVRNVRSRLTWEAGLVRVTARGGIKIHDILIDGVMDLTEPGEAARGSSCIRIGDKSCWDAAFNQPGDMRNIIVRNVMTRSQFAFLVSDHISDALFDGITIYGDNTMAMYFNNAMMKNVTVSNLRYDMTAEPKQSDIGWGDAFHKIPVITELSAVHFNDCTAENVIFNGVTSGKNLTNVFGGNSNIEIVARDVHMNDEYTRLSNCANVIIK